MVKSLVRGLVFAALAVTAALPVSASAAGGGGAGNGGMTITIGSPITLRDKLLVTVPVTVTCIAPISIDPTMFQPGSIDVQVQQAGGKSVSHGSGAVELDSCSPAPQTFYVQVTPDLQPASGPFKKGAAIVQASGVISDFNFPQTVYLGSTGWLTTRIG